MRGEVTVLEGEFAGVESDAQVEPYVDSDLVVFAGRHIPEKRVPALVPALAALPGLRAELYGDGPERGRVLALIAEHGLADRVSAPGFVDHARIDAALRRALCMVLPSRREGYGLVVIEACAAGTPAVVVADPDNAATELIEEGVNGFVAASASPEDLAAAITRVREAGPELRASTAAWYAANARRLSLAESLERVAAAYRGADDARVRDRRRRSAAAPLLEACLADAAGAPLSPLATPSCSWSTTARTASQSRTRGSCRRAATSASPAASSPASKRRAGEWILLVNDDAELEPGAAVRAAGRVRGGPAEVGMRLRAGPLPRAARHDQHRRPGRRPRSASPSTGSPARRAVEGGPVEEVFGASACVALYRRAMLDAIGGFDASFFAFGEDADVAWRARTAGWSCLYVPASVAYHHGSATAGEASARKYFLVGRNRMRLLAKNATGGQLARWGWAMALYDLAYVAFVALTDRTLAPLRGPPHRPARVAGLPPRGRRDTRPGAARRADRPARRLAAAEGLPRMTLAIRCGP